MKNYLLLAAVMLAVFLSPGCGRKSAKPTLRESTQTNLPAGALSAPSKQGVISLCSDENAYIRNSAKQALSAWESEDYTGAVIAMQKVMSLCQSSSQQEAALSSLAQLKQEIDAAAAKGSANAKEAAAQLAQPATR